MLRAAGAWYTSRAMEPVLEELADLDEAACWRELLASPQLPYAAVPFLAPEQRAAKLVRDARAALAAGGAVLRLTDAGGATRGLAVLEELPHESRHFERRCARLRFVDAWAPSEAERARGLAALARGALACSARRGIDLLWTQLRAIDYALQEALQSAGFRFADALVDWVARAEALALAPADEERIEHGARPALAESCGALAATAMRYNRFRADPRFEPARVDALYAELGARCARGEIGAHFVHARGAGGELLGFAALDWAERRAASAPFEMASFRFLVRANAAPPGTGRALLDAGCRWLRGQGAEVLLAQTVLQNAGMFRSALSLGFRVEDALYDLFWWRRA